MDARLFLLERARSSWRAAGGPGRVVAAVSGGADSAALLEVLQQLSREEGFFLAAAHVDHGLRPESGADAEFVSGLCRKMGIPCRVIRVRLSGPSENEARAARYEALLSACREARADALALAHHQRDQAETVLLHLFRGSGSSGLGGMAEVSRRSMNGQTLLLWRPFLDVPPDALSRFLLSQGLSWREDATNAYDDYLRNYLRHRVLPAVRERIPKAEEAIGRAARVLSDEAQYFEGTARAFLQVEASVSPPCFWIRYPAFKDLHPALKRHVVRLGCPVPLDFDRTEALLSLSPGQWCNLPAGYRALCTKRYLHFIPASPPPASAGTLQVLPYRGDWGDGIRAQAMPKSVFDQCILRFRQTGDRIRPLGGPGDKSLQDYWVDRGIDRPFRPYLPLLCMGKRVVWSVGIGAAEEARVRPGDEAVLLRYEGFLPGPKSADLNALMAGTNDTGGRNE